MSRKAEDPEKEQILEPFTHQNYLLEGTSRSTSTDESNESTSDSTPSTSFSTSGDQSLCDNCNKTANLAYWKTRNLEGGKTEDIFRNYCEICNLFFGICSKKVRGAFVFVTNEGRVLSLAEKMEIMRAEKKKKNASRKNSEEIIEPVNSDTSTNGNSEEKEEEETIEKEAHEKRIPEAAIHKKHRFKKGGKTHWTQRKKKSSTQKSPASKEPSCSTKKTSRIVPKLRSSTKKETEQSVIKESAKSDVPKKSRSARTASVEVKKKPSVSAVETAENAAQTDPDILLKSNYVEEMIDHTIRESLNQQVAVRLAKQPMLLRKQFVMMMKTIREQEKKIENYRNNEEKYRLVVMKMSEFGRNARLEFSDSFRHIRADLIERKEEFKAHGSEVAVILRKEREKLEACKTELRKLSEDQKVLQESMEAKLSYLTEESNFERERADFYHRKSKVSEKEKNEAKITAEKAVTNLNDRLFVANNERCTSCKAVETVRKKMTQEVAEITQKMEKATAERNEAVSKATLFESAAQKLGRDCDSIKYERDSWKAYAERFKKDVNKLTQTLKEKEKELTERTAEAMMTPRSHPSSVTPRSVACTPGDVEQKVSPPEDGEIIETSPQTSPRVGPNNKALSKPVPQKILEKKTTTSVASGFSSWIPKEKLNAPTPEIPRALSAFGPPIKTPQQKEDEKKTRIASLQQTPWERASAGPSSMLSSGSLAEALSRAQAEAFVKPNDNGSNYQSKSYTEELNRQLDANRKRKSESMVGEPKKDIYPPQPSNPPTKKQKPNLKPEPVLPTASPSPQKIIPASSKTPTSAVTPGSSIGSLTNMKKIPKISDKAPLPEFAPALGLTDHGESSSIPGFGMLDEVPKKSDVLCRKILPAEPKQPVPARKPTPPAPVEPASKPAVLTQKTVTKPAEVQPAVKKNSSQQNQKNNHTNTPKWSSQQKKNTPNNFSNHSPWDSRDSWDLRGSRDSWDTRNQCSGSWVRHPQQQQSHHNQYGIHSGSQPSFSINYDDRPWSDSRGSSSSFSFSQERDVLPWHREHETPFGRVPIQDSFPSGRPPLHQNPPQMPFYNSTPQRDNHGSGNFYSSSQGRGNPRPFYG